MTPGTRQALTTGYLAGAISMIVIPILAGYARELLTGRASY
jgi:hypothetical protein